MPRSLGLAENQGVASRGSARWCGLRISDEVRDQLGLKFAVLFPHLDERQRRLLMGAEVRILGHGGIRAVAQAAEASETTVRKGVDELEAGAEPLGRVRCPGGGRKRAAEVDPGLRRALLALVEPDMRGDPMSPLRWTTSDTGIKVTDSDIDALPMHRHRFHGDWNYTLHPQHHETAGAAEGPRSAEGLPHQPRAGGLRNPELTGMTEQALDALADQLSEKLDELREHGRSQQRGGDRIRARGAGAKAS